MRRLFLLGAVLAALAMLMAPALAGADDDDDDDGGGGGDRAFCAPAGPPAPGQCSYPLQTSLGQVIVRLNFDFDASSGPMGENPTGTYREERVFQGFIVLSSLEVQITCLRVTGSVASFGGRITASSNPALVNQGAAYTVVDNTPLAADRITDTQFLAVPPAPNTANCGSSSTPTRTVMGDIVVQDNIADDDDDNDDDEDDDDDDEDEDDDD